MRKLFLSLCILLVFGLFEAGFAGVRLEVIVQGLDERLKDNVLKLLSLERQKDAPELNIETVRSLYEGASQEIRTALQPFGYYRPEIKSELVKTDGTWVARFQIEKGKPVRISDMDLEISGQGAETGPFRTYRKNYPLKKGDILNQLIYEKSKKDLQELAIQNGYLRAELTEHQVLVYPERNEALVQLHMDTGPRFSFGEVTFEQKAFNTRFLNRFVPFKRGDPYSVSGLLKLQSALSDSDYFSRIKIEPEPGQAEGLQVPIRVILEAKKPNQIFLGAGYGTDTGFRGRIDWQNRRINRRGHRMETDLRLSEIKRSLEWKYIIPMKKPLIDRLELKTSYSTEFTETYKSKIFLSGASYSHSRGRHFFETLFLNFQQEQFKVGGESSSSGFLMPGAVWTYKRTEERPFVREGLRLIMEVKGAAEPVLSALTFVQGRVQPKYILGIGGSSRLILRADAGATAVNKFDSLPASLRFFAGGDTSIRGFSYKTVGPKNSAGQVIGGKHILVGSIEYEKRIMGNWGAAVFFDIGNAFNNFPEKWKYGTGIGVRWISPVGPFKVDFAWGVSEPNIPMHIHVSIGPEI